MAARKLREWYPGAIYHLMGRGIRRLEIYTYEEDYLVFLAILETALAKYKCVLHAYCLMTNHFHLLLETTDHEVWHLMKQLIQLYAMYYNHAHHFKGHVFEDRYKSCLVKSDVYFLQTSRYIHLNPVKAKMCLRPEQYRWSSYRCIAMGEQSKIVSAEKTLAYFGARQAATRYIDFIEDIAHKYVVDEESIRKTMGEDELWLPW